MSDTPEQPPTQEQLREEIKKRILSYNQGIIDGKIIANRWLYAAAKRFEVDLLRTDVYFDWDEAVKLNQHFEKLSLVGEWSDKKFKLQDWQLYAVTNIMCWKLTEDKRRKYKLCVLQVARGAGKTTLMAGLALYDLMNGMGKRVHILANNQDQAEILLDTAKTIISRFDWEHDLDVHYSDVVRQDADCTMTALPALERSLDGLNPSFWVADEAAEYKGRFLTKLLTTGAKRKESTGVIITTPGSNGENIYGEIVKNCEAILSNEIQDDTIFSLLYGLDKEDDISDEKTWVKANPGLGYGQPDLVSLRRSYNTMKQSPMGIAEFNRFHMSRLDENTGNWLDCTDYEKMIDPAMTPEFLSKRMCWLGVDLSKSGDMTAIVAIFPLDDGRCFVKGRYFFPKEGLAQRELAYRMPCRTWAKEGKLELCAGREIDYEQIRIAINDFCKEYDVKGVALDPWNSKMLAESLQSDGVPIQAYRMNNSTFAPGCQLWQNMWMGRKLIFNNDPIMRRACAEAYPKKDINGFIRPIKSREFCIIDPLVAGIMALHLYGGKTASIYEIEADMINGASNGYS
jgi:phage terminase large subunit-like protein